MRGTGLIAAIAIAGCSLALVPARSHAEPPRRAAVVIAGMRATGKEADELAARVRMTLMERSDVVLLPEKDESYLFRSARPKTGRSRKNLAAAKKSLESAAKHLNEFDLPAAVKAVTKAKSSLQSWIGLRAAVDLDRERLQLAVAIAHAQRDERRLSEALKEYAVRFPGEPPPQGLWPPDVLNRLKNAAEDRATVLNVRSEPRGKVYIDGREVGMAPVRLGALPAGEHRVEIEASGYFATDAWVETNGAKESVLEVMLIPNLSRRLEKARIDRAFDPGLVTAIREAAPLDFVIAANVGASGKLTLRRVDVSARGSGSTEGAEVAAGDTTKEGIHLALAQLFEAPASAGGGSPSKLKVPVWAWIGGGAGALAVGAGVVMRLKAVSTYNEYDQRQGALTQAEAYELRDRSDSQAQAGTVLLGVGVAAIAGIAGWLVLDVLPSSSGSSSSGSGSHARAEELP